MPFIGNQPAESYSAFQKQDFSTSATTSYTLDNPVANANELALFINFVRQEPTTAYSASGTSLTLTSATASSDDMYCVYLGKAIQTVNPPNASVGTSQLVDGAVTSAKLDSGVALGKVLQVVTATDSTQRTTTSTSYVTASNTLTANITPSASSSKILIMLSTTGFNASNNYSYYTIYRDSTNVTSNSSQNELSAVYGDGGVNIVPLHISFLDSPNTTSQVTYQAYMKVNGSTGYFNVNGNTGSIILMEIGA